MVYVAAVLIVVGVALFVAAPLGDDLLGGRRARRWSAETERLEHERGLAMQGLRELEFDREMGKLSEADYAALRESLMQRALSASEALEGLRAGAAPRPRLVKQTRAPVPSGPPSASSTRPARIRFCPQCGSEVAPGNFCCECGAPLSVAPRAAARAER